MAMARVAYWAVYVLDDNANRGLLHQNSATSCAVQLLCSVSAVDDSFKVTENALCTRCVQSNDALLVDLLDTINRLDTHNVSRDDVYVFIFHKIENVCSDLLLGQLRSVPDLAGVHLFANELQSAQNALLDKNSLNTEASRNIIHRFKMSCGIAKISELGASPTPQWSDRSVSSNSPSSELNSENTTPNTINMNNTNNINNTAVKPYVYVNPNGMLYGKINIIDNKTAQVQCCTDGMVSDVVQAKEEKEQYNFHDRFKQNEKVVYLRYKMGTAHEVHPAKFLKSAVGTVQSVKQHYCFVAAPSVCTNNVFVSVYRLYHLMPQHTTSECKEFDSRLYVKVGDRVKFRAVPNINAPSYRALEVRPENNQQRQYEQSLATAYYQEHKAPKASAPLLYQCINNQNLSSKGNAWANKKSLSHPALAPLPLNFAKAPSPLNMKSCSPLDEDKLNAELTALTSQYNPLQMSNHSHNTNHMDHKNQMSIFGSIGSTPVLNHIPPVTTNSINNTHKPLLHTHSSSFFEPMPFLDIKTLDDMLSNPPPIGAPAVATEVVGGERGDEDGAVDRSNDDTQSTTPASAANNANEQTNGSTPVHCLYPTPPPSLPGMGTTTTTPTTSLEHQELKAKLEKQEEYMAQAAALLKEHQLIRVAFDTYPDMARHMFPQWLAKK